MKQHEHKATVALPSDEFDRTLSNMIGLPNGAHTAPTVVQNIDFYGHATAYIVQTVRTDEGVSTFVTQVNAGGTVRYILPDRVLATIDRQRSSITHKVRSRHGKRIAEERKAQGITPFARKGK